ncbi:MAG TPA: hypothetical protein VG455_06740 [Acidimicrobiales bacterium]|nr:hypothetical protein [Acidimicrobiales bacterium]
MTAAPCRGTVVIAGSLAQKPRHGGHTWVFLQYLLGFRRLGWDVLFVDRLPPGFTDAGGAAAALDRVMHRSGLDGCWSLLADGGEAAAGLPFPEVLSRTSRSALVLNVMGFLTDERVLGAAPRRVFLDIDPGFPQMWRALGLADLFSGHDDFVTIGESIGEPTCHIPTCGLPWVTTCPPVVLDHWPPQPGPGEAVTSVATWRGAYAPVEYAGRTYGLRAHELRRFAALPASSPLPLHLALDIHPADHADRARLQASGWTLVDPETVAADPWSYRRFIQDSAAELMVAKNMYVRSRSGWLSDRSLCYLASGRPVVAQDTGFSVRYPSGLGLLAFSDFDEAVEALGAVAAEPVKHGVAGRELAEAYFDSDLVLTRLLEKLGIA